MGFPGAGGFPSPESSYGGRPADGHGEIGDPTYESLRAAITDADDLPERLRAELALGIFLLGSNYSLTAGEFLRLLEFPPGDPLGVAGQRAFHEIAVAHARPPLPRLEARRCPLGWFRAFLRCRAS